MWPRPVEDVARVLRESSTDARLEELAAGESDFPGPGVQAEAFAAGGRLVVALVPSGRRADPTKLGCREADRVSPPPFPFRSAAVHLDRTLLGEQTVWIEAGSPRHVAGLSPAHLVRIVRAQSSDVVAEMVGERR